jgi:cleavage and polyadenylation specificity factor subunit 1
MGEYLTRYITVASMPDSTAESIAKAFYKNIITRHGVPEMVLTDQDQNFLSKLMDCLYKQCGVEAIRTSAYRPSATVWSNVQIERLPI